jgi:hypothetical protein
MEADSGIKLGEGVRYEKMDGRKIYTLNVGSLFVCERRRAGSDGWNY